MRPGRPPLYPWSDWLDGEEHLLTPGVDFADRVQLPSLRNQIYAEAKKRGLRVSVQRYGDGFAIRAGAGPAPRSGGRPSSSFWDEILDGEVRHLRPGLDFKRSRRGLVSMRAAAHQAAKRRGVHVRTMTMSDGSLMVIADTKLKAIVEGSPVVEEFVPAPPFLVDEGIDEDSVFEACPWEDSNVLEPAAGATMPTEDDPATC